jgi:acyl-CoA hydrolase
VTIPRPSSASRSTLAIITDPGQANGFGTIHGGVILRLADECGGLAAFRHCGGPLVTTAAIDGFTFLLPVHVGERVELISEITFVGRTSMEARIDVYAESMMHPDARKVGSGYGVYVALDDDRKPKPVPPLLSLTEADYARDVAAHARQAARLARREIERHS